ncbi:MAG: hypothetical protein ACI4J0_06250 [Huintestinicola sp.]|uniref:hypothetical protein n=1 Tax=Huintestinicola sp. TaxID=2981661 RepID=UPI003F0C330D
MKRKAVCLALSLNFLLMAAGCNYAENEAVSEDTSAPGTSSPITETSHDTETISQTSTVTESTSLTEASSEADVAEIKTEISETAEEISDTVEVNSETAEEISYPEEIYTENEIYIYSFECGYLSQDKKPPNKILFIETDEQLSFAEDRYGLAVPTDMPWWYDTGVADAFQEMKASYPLSDHSYAVCYDEVSCGGYYLHADKLIKKGELLYFGMDDKSYTPSYEEEYPDVESGFCHMAAFPKDLFKGDVFSNAVYPDKNELTQDINYSFRLMHNIGSSKLYDAFGDEVILIHSQEEYEDFLKQTEDHLTDNRQIKLPIDFEQVTAAVCFFTSEYKYFSVQNNGIIISEGNVSIDYDIDVNPNNDTKNPNPMTCMIYVTIPKRFLE